MDSPLLALVLLPGTLQLAAGLSVTHTGPPIMVSLANSPVTFTCSISYIYTSSIQNSKISYSYTNLKGSSSSLRDAPCSLKPGTENQTATTTCPIEPELPSAAASGTYYCWVQWGSRSVRGNGTFILVRDSGYQEPPRKPQKLLFFFFLGILMVLSVLSTMALLWRKKQVKALQKPPARKCPDPHPASSSKQPLVEPIYTDLQRQDTEVYACLQNSPSPENLLPQEEAHSPESCGESNLVYENL